MAMKIREILIGFFIVLVLSFFLINIVFAISAMYQRCEPNKNCIIGEYIFDDDGHTPITTDNFCQITITGPNDTVVVNNKNMSYKNDGWYYYSTSTLNNEGLYRTTICCDTGANRKCIDKTFIVGTSFENLPEKTWSYTTRKLTSRQVGETEYIAGVSSSSTVSQVADQPTQENVKYNIGLVRKATFDFAGIADGGSTTTLIDSELNQPDDHWNNYELWIMSGNNIGLKRAICDFDQASHTITLCGDALSQPIEAGDQYVISHERKLVHAIWNWSDRQLTSVGNIASAVWGWTTRSLTTRKIATSSTEYIAGVSSSSTVSQVASSKQAENIHSDLQKQWTVYLSDFGEVLAGKTYRAKLWILNYESVPTDAYATPTLTIYDAVRNKVVENVEMTKISTGIYEYTYSVPSTAVQGAWETDVSAEVEEAGKIIKRNDYWEVEGSPAQVKINSITDNTIPSISANVTISNEGSAGYEYQYEWCVVSSEDNACGGGDDVFYSSAAKYIQAGEDWNTVLNATVSNTGSYWFKVVVYYGTEKSGASQTFTTIKKEEVLIPEGSSRGIVNQSIMFCKIFPCSIINKILTRLTSVERRTNTLTSNIVRLEQKMEELNRTIELLTLAPSQVKRVKRVIMRRKSMPRIPKRRVKIRLETR